MTDEDRTLPAHTRATKLEIDVPSNGTFGPWLGLDGPTFEVLKLLNRRPPGTDAPISLHRITPPRRPGLREFHEPLAAIHPADFDRLLPIVREHIIENTYHPVNAGRAARESDWQGRRQRMKKQTLVGDGLLPVHRRASDVAFLNAVWADIDCHTVGLTPGQAFGRAFDMQLEGRLPSPSLFVFSGRGMWLIWMIHDGQEASDGGITLRSSQPANPEVTDLWRRVQRTIAGLDELQALGSDPKSTDAARLTRLTGSLNSKTNTAVRVLPQYVNGRIATYDLDTLAKFFHVVAPATIQRALSATTTATPTAPRPRDTDRPKDPLKQEAARIRWQYALADFEALMALRGNRFQEGCRQTACFIYALLLRRNGIRAGRDLNATVLDLAARSGLDLDEGRKAIESSANYTTANLRHAWCANQLQVTPEEAQQLTNWPAAGEEPDLPITRTTEARRAELLRLVAAHGGHPPTLRAMTDTLAAKGFQVCLETVANDYRHLNLQSHQKPGPSKSDRLPF